MVSRLIGLFRRALKTHPVKTNAAVYAMFYAGADLSQQTYGRYFTPEKPEIDFNATARLALIGSTIYAPSLYYWYRFLDQKFAGTALKTVAVKVCCDQFIMTPILLAVFYTVFGILDRKADIFEELRAKFLMTFAVNQVYWIPCQTINFLFIPSHLRVVYVASVAFIWINIICSIKRQKIVSKEQQ